MEDLDQQMRKMLHAEIADFCKATVDRLKEPMTTKTALSDLQFSGSLRDKVREDILAQVQVPINSLKTSFSVYTRPELNFKRTLQVDFMINDDLFCIHVDHLPGKTPNETFDYIRKELAEKIYELLTLSDGYKESLGAFLK